MFTVTFKKVKETKGTHVYAETNADGTEAGPYAKIGTLYVRKTAFAQGEPVPETITVTVA